MISLERKKEIITEVEYSVNRHISKQSVVYYAIDDLLTEEEKEWYEDNCFGNYVVQFGDFEE